jgi:hypothetical protein
MADIGVALLWIAMSAASARGLAALARIAASGELEAEIAAMTAEGTSSGHASEHDRHSALSRA